jgi:hypothetical protein
MLLKTFYLFLLIINVYQKLIFCVVHAMRSNFNALAEGCLGSKVTFTAPYYDGPLVGGADAVHGFRWPQYFPYELPIRPPTVRELPV